MMSFDSPAYVSETISISRESDATCVALLTFEIYLEDARYRVPTLKLVTVPDSANALRIAQLLLDESPHHLGAEVCHEGQRIAGLGSYAVSR